MKLLSAKKVHLVGIKGVAMTALALCLSDLGIEVTGSDVAEEFVTQNVLQERAFRIFTGFDPSHLDPATDVIVYTGAHQGEHNPEVVAGIASDIATMSHAEALGQLIDGKRLISVCGTGGKSTTSAMLAWILEEAGLSPSFAVGVGNIPNFGVPGRFKKDSEWFVAEADEYAVDPTGDLRPRFIFQHPEIIVCTNLNYDHPDVYFSFERTKEVFLDFFNSLPDNGRLILNGDDEELMSLVPRLATKASVQRIGTSDRNDCYLHDIVSKNGRSQGIVSCSGDSVEPNQRLLDLEIPGAFNLMNAQMALEAGLFAGVSEQKALTALSTFRGTMRRFERKENVKGALWYDDYAHTPTEIQSTLTALRQWLPGKRVIAIFQPHTYSRTKALFSGFSRSFTQADETILLPVFASARESADDTVSSDLLAESIEKQGKKGFVKSFQSREEAVSYLRRTLLSNDVVITLGAGDVYKIYDEIKETV